MTPAAVMILDHQQVRADALRLADDGLVRRKVPVRGDVDIDAVLADARREFLELLASRGLHFALPGLEVDVAALQRLGVQRRRDVVKQRELRA